MLPEDTDRGKFISNLGTSPEVVKARNSMDAIKADGGWSDISFPNKRAFLFNPNPIPDDIANAATVLDLTAGGGSIPFEAGRLGFRTIANELNPVACLILKATCEWPQRFGRQLLDDYQEVSRKFQGKVAERLSNAYPEEPQPDCANGNCPTRNVTGAWRTARTRPRATIRSSAQRNTPPSSPRGTPKRTSGRGRFNALPATPPYL